MTPSISILTPFCASESHSLKRPRGALAPFQSIPVTSPGSVFISNSGITTTTTTTTTTVCTSNDAYDGAPLGTSTNTSTRQWTGMPIRAIVPLPRRCRHVGTLGPSHSDVNGPIISNENGTSPQVAKVGFGQPLVRSAANVHTHHVQWDEDEDGDDEDELDHEDDAVDSGREMELDHEINDKDMDGGEDQSRSRCCSYQCITAAGGLSAWSFEELRVECYAQSLIARGTRPPPVVHPSLAIPPAFAPRILLRIQPRSS